MKFIDKYHNMSYANGTIPVECDGIIRSTRELCCCACGAPTEFIEINYEDSFCSEECVAEMDRRCDECVAEMIRREEELEQEDCYEAQEGRTPQGCRPFG